MQEAIRRFFQNVGLLKGIEEIGVLQLSSDDVVRHPLVQKIIDRYGEKGE